MKQLIAARAESWSQISQPTCR